MMIIRPVAAGDLQGLLTLAGETGGGLTSLPADENTLAARIARSQATWQGTLPRGDQGYVFVLEDTRSGAVVGVCAIEVAVGINDPWYNYRVGTLVHASKELNVYNALPTLFLTNDHTGSSELCTLFLDPDWRKEGNGYLLSKSRFMFMAAFRDKFNDKVVAEMRGVIDEHGYSPFWQSLGKRFFSMDFSRADFLCGTGQKAFIAELMPKHPIYTYFLSQEAQDVIGQVHPQTAPARAVLEKEGFRYRNYIDIFDGGPTLECDIDRVRAVVEDCTQLPVHPRHPYAGDLVYTAFSGSHQDAIKKGFAQQHAGQAWTVPYLPIDPADVRRGYDAVIRVNSQSGKGGVSYLLQQTYGLALPRRLQIEFSRVVQTYSDTAGGEVDAAALHRLFSAEYLDIDTPYAYASHQQHDDDGRTRLSVTLRRQGEPYALHGEGNGPIDAFVAALGLPLTVLDYHEHAIGAGADARAACYVELRLGESAGVFGVGVDSHIVAAALKAVLSALNRQLRAGR